MRIRNLPKVVNKIKKKALLLICFVSSAAYGSGAQLSCDEGGSAVAASRVEDEGQSYLVYWPIEQKLDLLQNFFTPEVGASVLIGRCLGTGGWSEVARGEVLGVTGKLAVARVVGGEGDAPLGVSSVQAVRSGNLYQRPMGGDFILPVVSHVAVQLEVTPRFEYSWKQMFSYRQFGSSEVPLLSEEGKERLRAAWASLSSSSGQVLVESYTQGPGPRKLLQIETQMRADSVAAFLKREFDLPEEKLLSVGFGADIGTPGLVEIDPSTGREKHEAIVLRVISK